MASKKEVEDLAREAKAVLLRKIVDAADGKYLATSILDLAQACALLAGAPIQKAPYGAASAPGS